MLLNHKIKYTPILLGLLIFTLMQCQSTSELKTGKEIYQAYCVNCHGVDGKLAAIGAIDLSRSGLSKEGRVEIIKNGRVTMMGFQDVLTSEQIDSVASYTFKLKEE